MVIYGAGRFGRDLADVLVDSGVTVLGFLDRNGRGQDVGHGLEAHSLGSPEARAWQAGKPVAMVGVHNPSVSVGEIVEMLKKAGFADVVTPMEVYYTLHRELTFRYWLGAPHDYMQAGPAIERACHLWADEKSKTLFLRTLLYRLTFDWRILETPEGADSQYAAAGLPRWNDPLRIIDGGAYTGDSLRNIGRQGYAFGAIYAFEPDLENFAALRQTLASAEFGDERSLWPCGVWSKTCRLNFSSGGGPSSQLSESGSASVPVVALDDVLHGQQINLIKLDIEGAELDALEGAKKIIERQRPGLAICAYHQPQHLWTFPAWVADLQLGYRMYLRSHEHNTFDTVLYAFPSARA